MKICIIHYAKPKPNITKRYTFTVVANGTQSPAGLSFFNKESVRSWLDDRLEPGYLVIDVTEAVE